MTEEDIGPPIPKPLVVLKPGRGRKLAEECIPPAPRLRHSAEEVLARPPARLLAVDLGVSDRVAEDAADLESANLDDAACRIAAGELGVAQIVDCRHILAKCSSQRR
jgi:hypothetical protein